MATITADDIRVLARAENPDAVLAVVGGVPTVLASEDAEAAIYTRRELVAEFGEEITDIEAEVLAGGLTARVAD